MCRGDALIARPLTRTGAHESMRRGDALIARPIARTDAHESMRRGDALIARPQNRPGLNGCVSHSQKPPLPDTEQGAFVKAPEEGKLPRRMSDYFTVPRSLTVIAVAGMASMASETVISPLNILATRSL